MGEEDVSVLQGWPRRRPSPGCAAVVSTRAPGWRQPVVNTAAPRLQQPRGGSGTLSLSAAPCTAERGGEAKQRGLGWHRAGPCPQGWQQVPVTCRRAAQLWLWPHEGTHSTSSSIALGFILPTRPQQ